MRTKNKKVSEGKLSRREGRTKGKRGKRTMSKRLLPRIQQTSDPQVHRPREDKVLASMPVVGGEEREKVAEREEETCFFRGDVQRSACNEKVNQRKTLQYARRWASVREK